MRHQYAARSLYDKAVAKREELRSEVNSLRLKLKTRDKMIKDLIEERDRAISTKPAVEEYVPRRTWND